jgi:hypothetical protein
MVLEICLIKIDIFIWFFNFIEPDLYTKEAVQKVNLPVTKLK